MGAEGHELRTAGLEKPVKVTIGQPSGDQNAAYQWSYTNHCSDKISDTQAH